MGIDGRNEGIMMRGMMLVWENEKELQEMIKKERDVHKRERLQMLYLLKTKQAKNRKEVARLLGVNRETVGDWLAKYEQGGLDKLLEIAPKGGSQSSLPEKVIEGMREKLAEPAGFISYKALLAWVMRTFTITTTYWVVYYTATKILKARPAVARRSHIKKKKVQKKPSNPALQTKLDKQSKIQSQLNGKWRLQLSRQSRFKRVS